MSWVLRVIRGEDNEEAPAAAPSVSVMGLLWNQRLGKE